ncbi:DUF2321 domain-containing protein [Qipengyuania psychrotolerans]|uniref:DUF2321 domain-containing protein n=1 Tax=Qipengyuania psychrotolerans TaxID=2867238 RepID=A0ABX8ZGM2_9SPHN|nr:DUF2321 domain-containing protein [Qipengyuania psychrotolerans]
MDRYRDLYEDSEWTDIQQVCLNGHLITEYAVSQPSTKRKHCPDCGEVTLMACPKCNTDLRGHRHIPGVVVLATVSVGKICPDCGSPYPWAEAARAAAREWVGSLSALTEASKEELGRLLVDIFSDTPRTRLACHRLKKFLSEMPADEAQPFVETLLDAAGPSASEQLRNLRG